MNRRTVRNLLAVLVLITTVVATGFFLRDNPNVLDQLAATSPVIIFLLFGLYLLFMVSLWLIFASSLILSNATLPRGETMLVTAYSSIINFFGPLQSGPAFRAIYLKQRHKVSLKRYALASLVYYFFYAFFSAICLLSGLIGWWVLIASGVGIGIIFLVTKLPNKRLAKIKSLNRRGVILTAIATVLQIVILITIFYVELRSVDASVTLQQAITYTGAANFALFVSITPGAIGFRETFVLAAQQLHSVPDATIVAASLLDRAVYVMMLVFLAIGIFGSHAQKTIDQLKAK